MKKDYSKDEGGRKGRVRDRARPFKGYENSTAVKFEDNYLKLNIINNINIDGSDYQILVLLARGARSPRAGSC